MAAGNIIARVESKLDAILEAQNAKFDVQNAKIAAQNAKIAARGSKIDGIRWVIGIGLALLGLLITAYRFLG